VPASQYVPTSPGSLTDELAPLQRPPKPKPLHNRKNQETKKPRTPKRNEQHPFDERRNDRKNRKIPLPS
jgi:hypothetical protein